MPRIGLRAGTHVDAAVAMDPRVDLPDLASERALQRHRQRLDDDDLLAQGARRRGHLRSDEARTDQEHAG